MIYLLLILGLIMLIVGSEFLVRGSLAIAHRFRLSEVFIGLTIVAFGTSAPELVVSVDAVLSGATGIAVGTIVGSNIANILLILGLPAILFSAQDQFDPKKRDIIVLIFSGILTLAFAYSGGGITRWEAGILFIFLWSYLLQRYFFGERTEGGDIPSNANPEQLSVRLSVIFILIGIAGLWLGSFTLVPSAQEIAKNLGVLDKVIGIVMVGVGTSLPELATSLVAFKRKSVGMAVGNVIGSNLFNILGVLGVTGLISPFLIGRDAISKDIPIMILVSCLLIIPKLLKSKTGGRITGFAFLIGYAAYITSQF